MSAVEEQDEFSGGTSKLCLRDTNGVQETREAIIPKVMNRALPNCPRKLPGLLELVITVEGKRFSSDLM
jgi:hypothetical protein